MGVGKATSLALGHSCRVQLLPFNSRTRGGRYTASSLVLMPGLTMELEEALSYDLFVLAVSQENTKLRGDLVR